MADRAYPLSKSTWKHGPCIERYPGITGFAALLSDLFLSKDKEGKKNTSHLKLPKTESISCFYKNLFQKNFLFLLDVIRQTVKYSDCPHSASHLKGAEQIHSIQATIRLFCLHGESKHLCI